MQKYVDACARHTNAARLGPLLDRIISDEVAHTRFVNMLARLEYVGVRKILKSRRSDRLDLEGLQHILDEAVHALRLKKAAAALAATSGADVVTFSDDVTLAGGAGEDYLQSLDRRAEQILDELSDASDFSDGERAELNYLLTSAAIEVRAQVFYPIYEERLRASGAPFSVSAISKDEDRHLTEMSAGLEQLLPRWREPLERVLLAEEVLFERLLDAVEDSLENSVPIPISATR